MSFSKQKNYDWFSSDLHLNHHNIIKFSPQRGSFSCVEEHNELLIANWNKDVSPKDRVLITGDLAFNSGTPLLGRLNGVKDCVMGNHEHKHISEYLPYFEDIKAYYEDKANTVLFSHMPVHPSQLHRWDFNVHGHTHGLSVAKSSEECIVPKANFDGGLDLRYVNISLEMTAMKPVSRSALYGLIERRRAYAYGGKAWGGSLLSFEP